MTAWTLRTFFAGCAFVLRGSTKHLCDKTICRATFLLGIVPNWQNRDCLPHAPYASNLLRRLSRRV